MSQELLMHLEQVAAKEAFKWLSWEWETTREMCQLFLQTRDANPELMDEPAQLWVCEPNLIMIYD